MKRMLGCSVALVLLSCSGSNPGTVKEKRPLGIEEASEVTQAVGDAISRVDDVMQLTFRRHDHATGCLSALEVDPGDFCGDTYAKHVLVAWDACPLLGGGQSSGKVDINNDRATAPAGTPCESATRFTSTHDSSYDFTAEPGSGGLHEVHVVVDASSEAYVEGPPPSHAAADVSVQAKGTDASGGVLYDAQVDGTYDTVWDDSVTPPTRTVNAHTNVHLTRLNHDYDVNAVDLVFEPDCCHPLSGHADVRIVLDQTQYDAAVDFGPTCGEAVVNGESVTLPPCSIF